MADMADVEHLKLRLQNHIIQVEQYEIIGVSNMCLVYLLFTRCES